MNDPGLDSTIGQEATEVDGHVHNREIESTDGPELGWADDLRVREGDVAESLKPARWWIASTAIPLTAGTLGPMANAFSICSLTQDWTYRLQPDGRPPEDIPDQSWVIAVNAISLAFALIANFALLMNMARRIRFSVSQPIVIIGWYISSIMLICLLAVFKSYNDPKDGVLTQAYYYGVLAAAIYFFISSLLLVTVYGAYKGHYEKEFNLTTSQRTLMLQTIFFLVYLLAGAAVYAHIENWRYLNAIYWADFTLLTIGIGDFYPSTHLGRGLLFPFAMGGLLIIGLIIGSIRSLMLQKGRQKLAGRITEKTRRALLKRVLAGHKHPLSFSPNTNEDGSEDEVERRRREFLAMRQVRRIAELEQKWISLVISLTVWMMFWLLGGVAFWRSERDRGWTYFQALYFSYTSLLTIGYGDIYPVNNWAKPFFVFWSLLAVPTVTIFISNLGDTIVRGIRNATLYLGELTILPGEQSYMDRFKDLLRFAIGERGPEDTDEERQQEGSEPNRERARIVEQAESVMEQEELQEEEEAREKGDIRGENIHHYQYLLMHEIRKLFTYANSEPPKRFSYEEWAYYLKLLGEDESVATFHRAPPLEADTTSTQQTEYSEGENESHGKTPKWSWMGNRSPLMGDKEEAEWLLEAMSERLERELKKQRDETQSRLRSSKGNRKNSQDKNE
ncbi:hypothetical protein Plec18167_007454 [Paecilomyces lecythidis]|uniref:Potassium channel domain-containing protein n=1 Tax=Paecilomyces lecythidis TaxID=3004212 RepID=A0ABR3X3A5_9EURO